MREKAEGAYLESPPNRGVRRHNTNAIHEERLCAIGHANGSHFQEEAPGRTHHQRPAVTGFLLVDGAMKVVKPQVVMKTTVALGYAESVLLPLGLVLLACTTLSLMRRTAVLGAILLTGYVGGAVATHVRVGQGPFAIVFPVVLGVLLWA
jgi:DoxX-like family